jgi:hypothetical protein
MNSRQIKSMIREATKQSRNLYATGFTWFPSVPNNDWLRIIDAKTIHGMTTVKVLSNGLWYATGVSTKFDIR